MRPQGAGAEISAEEASDLLDKFVTESTRIHVAYVGSVPGLAATIQGIVRFSSRDQLFSVSTGQGITGPVLSFDPKQAIVRFYGDFRMLPKIPEKFVSAGGPKAFSSMLFFVFKDNSKLSLFEVEEST